jgi:hypothetical protein
MVKKKDKRKRRVKSKSPIMIDKSARKIEEERQSPRQSGTPVGCVMQQSNRNRRIMSDVPGRESKRIACRWACLEIRFGADRCA